MDESRSEELNALVSAIPEGWSRARIAGQAWGVTRTTHAGGKVISVSGERLSDNEQLSANVWLTSEGAVLKPCEVPPEKVMKFLRAAATAFST
ncbi:Uncharacterised protein [Mycobacterium tuberculosis]|jgi:peptide-methionine (S)-S-oxide reductase|nr:Uncharacterised protein [Mycobacterium tuberculosis]